LAGEVLSYLDPQANKNFVDGTLGDGGHTLLLLDRIAPHGRVLGLDLDAAAVEVAQRRVGSNRLVAVHASYAEMARVATEQGFKQFDGILIDLGYSTSTLERGKGFSFEKPEPLDMRYDSTPQSDRMTAAEVVNTFSRDELAEIFKEYGEERLSQEIAAAIIAHRKAHHLETTKDLVDVVLTAYRTKLGSKKEIPWIGGIHPATRTFQALRIYVNKELENLETVLPQCEALLAPGGRVAIISFHSLEDRIVKHYFKQAESLEVLTKKPIEASENELRLNPRSRSAKLRVAQKK
jgi:16S rRNA (cytosine1402-N4)-methyltransferase